MSDRLQSNMLPLKYICGAHFISSGEWIHKDRIRNDYELILVTEGVLKITVDNISYSVRPMEGIIIPPYKRHYGTEVTFEQISFYWIHFTANNNADINFEQSFFKLPKPEQFLQLFRHTLHISASFQYITNTVDYSVTLLVMELLAQLHIAENQKHPKLNEICEWIRIHPQNSGSVSELAEHFGYNKDYLCRLFKSAFGITLKHYLSESKIKQSKTLLMTTSLPVKQIADMVGITDEKAFYKFFKLNEGLTPTQFRNSFNNVQVNMD